MYALRCTAFQFQENQQPQFISSLAPNHYELCMYNRLASLNPSSVFMYRVLYVHKYSWVCSAGGIPTRLRAGRSGVRNPAGGRYVFLLQNVKAGLCKLSPQLNGNGDFLLGLKRPERDGGYSPLSSAEVKHEGSHTSAPPLCLRAVDRDSFTFYLSVDSLSRIWCCRRDLLVHVMSLTQENAIDLFNVGTVT